VWGGVHPQTSHCTSCQCNDAFADLTPENVLVDNNRIKIIDFGLSIAFESDNPRVLHSSGTPLFMSPEVLQNQIHNPMLTDVWSLGVLLYFMLTNSYPWSNNQKSKAELLDCIFCRSPEVSSFSEPVQSLILGTLTVDPEDRWNLSEIQLIVSEVIKNEENIKPLERRNRNYNTVSPKSNGIMKKEEKRKKRASLTPYGLQQRPKKREEYGQKTKITEYTSQVVAHEEMKKIQCGTKISFIDFEYSLLF